MPICRIYLLTYRRNHLLPRALNSLLNQTFTDWICELHNDDPTDPVPRQLVEQIADPRIIMIDHEKNLGATSSFNLAFQKAPEPFISLLEDDNWWEPHFLSTMIGSMKQFPKVQVAWANMGLWQEEQDGSWTNTGKAVWDCSEMERPRLFDWGQPQQMIGALHSNGAMLIRSQYADRYVIPDETPFAVVEMVRERAFPFPILFVPQVCANFAVTRTTSRSNDRSVWGQTEMLLAASFLKHIPITTDTTQKLWRDSRSQPAKSTGTLFFSAIVCSDCRYLLRFAALSDWLFFIASCMKRPLITLANLQAIKNYPQLWEFLDQQTAQRAIETRQSQSDAVIHQPSISKSTG